LANRFLRDLQDLSQPVFLVLDDYHVIQSIEIHHFMARLIQHPPANLHLVIITRMDPPLPLANMRGKTKLQEIRSHDLCFTGDEAAILVEQIVGESVEREIVDSLNRHTEGWPAGLRMAATSLLQSDDHKMYVQRYAESGQKPAMDYLLSEVLDHLPNEERLLILVTSVVDRFCAPLIDKLSEGSIPGIRGSDLLEALWPSNFFMVALYEKLEVHGRRQAVAKATRLGILTDKQ
jgi:LuxR family maltose regulon positive regulatory protein